MTETELLVGRLSFGSRFPQYLDLFRIAVKCGGRGLYFTTAMLTGAVVLAW